ncbi:MAG: hypothetical protein JWM47_1335 [Acidimicrobiales bacterium]|nr:hypothetical protein [Acidimicrobiales bacterium]
MPATFTSPSPRRTSRSLVLASLLALAACGGGSDGADATTTTAKAKAKAVTTTTEAKGAADDPEPLAGEVGANDMPTDEDDAPSGDWVGVRWLLSQDPEPEGFRPGQADVRLYTVEPDCGSDGCELTLSAGGDDDSFALPDLEPLTGPPIALEAGKEAWTAVEAEEPYGCSDELTGDYVDSESLRALAPVRDEEGDIVALLGTVTFTDEVNAAGEAAGCPDTAGTVDEYGTVMVPVDKMADAPTFEVDGTFRQSLEAAESSGYTEPQFQKGAISVTLEGHDLKVEGSCDQGDCSVAVTQAISDEKSRKYELEGSEDEGLSGAFSDTGGCYDPETGDEVFDDGAYDETGGVTQMVPLLVVDGEPQIFLGRMKVDSEPTALGKTEPACSTPQSIEGWVTWVAMDLLEA